MATERARGGGGGPALLRAAVSVMAVTVTLVSIAWALELFQWVGLNLYPAQIVSGILGLILALTFVLYPARRAGSVRWYDFLVATLSLASCWYVAVRYPQMADMTTESPWDTVTFGVIMVPVLLEALRRTTGYALPTIVAAFVLYGFLGHHIPGRFAALPSDWDVLAGFLALDGNAMMGGPILVACSIVISFLFFGNLLNATRGARFLTDLAQLTMGRFRGGSAKIAVVASALFGSISGSAVANVVATGVVTIPMIKKGGYAPHKAAAIEAVASTGGQLLPPVMGAAAFLMADFLETSYASVVLAALVPGVLYYFSLFLQADLEAARDGLLRLDSDKMPSAGSLVSGWFFAVPFAVLIVGLFVYNMLPQTAAIFSSAALLACSLVFGYRGFRPSLKEIAEAVRKTGVAVIDLVLICAGAGMVIGILSNSGLGFTFTNVLVQIGSGNLPFLLLLAAAVCIVLGMGLPTVGVYVLLAALVAPGLVEVGVHPTAAHLYVMYFGMMSMLTPPVAIAAFAAAGIANADPMRTGFAAVRFGWLAYVVPFLFVLSPSLILIGDPLTVAASVSTAAFGVWLVSIGVAGFLRSALVPVSRGMFVALGLVALLPVGSFEGVSYLTAISCLGGLLLVGTELLRPRR